MERCNGVIEDEDSAYMWTARFLLIDDSADCITCYWGRPNGWQSGTLIDV